MTRSMAVGLSLIVPMLAGSAELASAQMHMASQTMLVAQLDAKQVVGGSTSAASATGAFLLDSERRTLAYSLTYEGLSGRPKSIALYNFGRGKNGARIKELCGEAKPCPDAASATISGRLESGDGRPLDNNLIGEFASERVYVEIVGSEGKPEIRGQLAANTAMVMVSNYTVDLKPAAGTDSKGTGTAVVSETHLPGGKTAVFYAATVADTSGTPANAAIVSGRSPDLRNFEIKSVLPLDEVRSPPQKTTGGSLSGAYEVSSAQPARLTATRLMAAGKGESGLLVTTSRYPNGELYGVLTPVH